MAYTWSVSTKYEPPLAEYPSQCAGIFGALRFEHLPSGIKKPVVWRDSHHGQIQILRSRQIISAILTG